MSDRFAIGCEIEEFADGVRAITRLLFLVLFLGITCVPARAADETRIPSVALLSCIQLTVNFGWVLTINAGGSGSIGYGSHIADFAAVPVGTFDFEKVYSSLALRVRASLDAARVHELWDRSPPSDHRDYKKKLIARIADDIAGLKEAYPQLQDFSVAKHLQADNYVIGYSYHTHEPPRRGGWTSAVPNPDPDGIWLHIDFHDPDSRTQLHTQPIVAPYCVGSMKVLFLTLEGAGTKSVEGAIWGILKRHGIEECDP
jgi:hypothetical protein